jgi:hypothetical protein
MFECFNLLDTIEFKQGNFKILQLLLQVLIFFCWINGFIQKDQKLQNLVKKTQRILGVKDFCQGQHYTWPNILA